jgi:hypothetical protein
VIRIFIALKSQSPSAGLEPAKLEFNGKHDNNYTTENDCPILKKIGIKASVDMLL